MLICHKCDQAYGKRECGRCRLILKCELVEKLIYSDKVYLSESNRNKDGRPSKTKDLEKNASIIKKYQELRSYRKVAEEFEMSKDTVAKIVRNQ